MADNAAAVVMSVVLENATMRVADRVAVAVSDDVANSRSITAAESCPVTVLLLLVVAIGRVTADSAPTAVTDAARLNAGYAVAVRYDVASMYAETMPSGIHAPGIRTRIG